MTQSEAARHARAELETIAAGLRLQDLARLVELGRRLFEHESAVAYEHDAFSSAEGSFDIR